jgi:hypothetical protein
MAFSEQLNDIHRFINKDVKIKTYPFLHAVADNFFAPEIYDSLKEEFNRVLKNLNIVPTKSKILKPSIISEEYVNSYILGLIDGDGCFSLDKKNQLHLNVISSLSICQFVMDTLVKKCNITATKIIPEKRSKGIYYCYFGGNTKIAKIVNYIYKNNSCFLERKFKIANR